MVTAARGALIALTLVLFAPLASASEEETFYLGTDGFPRGSLVANPRGGEMPNFDLSRDVEPGLFLDRSSLGLAETDGTRYQHWQVDQSLQRLSGFPAVVIWAAPARFDPGKRGEFSVFLLDCNLTGDDCSELGAAQGSIEKGYGGGWVETRLDFAELDHTFDDDRYLGVRVVVAESSESGVMLAYGYPQHRSRLTISPEAPTAVEALVAGIPTPADDSEIATDKTSRMAVIVSSQSVEADGSATLLPWLASLAVSTVTLIALGAFLLSKLTKPGRHERRYLGGRSSPVRTRRVSVSAH